jgi:hypothetical protein
VEEVQAGEAGPNDDNIDGRRLNGGGGHAAVPNLVAAQSGPSWPSA